MSGLSEVSNTEEAAALDSVFHIVAGIGQRRSTTATASRSRFWDSDMRWYVGLVMGAPVLSILCAILGWWLESRTWQVTALILLTSSYITGPVLYPLVMLFRYRDRVKLFIRFPGSVLLDKIQRDATVDREAMRELADQADWALDHALAYFRLQRAGLERRTGLLVGALDKVGAIPSLATLAATLHSVGSFDAVATGPTWLEGALYGVFGLYAVGWLAHVSMMRMDRMIGALELAIEAKQVDQPPSAAQRQAAVAAGV